MTSKKYYKKSKTNSKLVKENADRYSRQIKQLDHIVKDLNYIPKDSTNGYHEFIQNMHSALVGGRKITRKMESAIKNIISRYTKWYIKEKDPNYQAEKKVYVDESMKKIKLIKDTLFEGKYSAEYESGAEYFLNSIGEQVKKKGSLTLKQRQSLNKMYKRFKKRVEKNAKKVKKTLD